MPHEGTAPAPQPISEETANRLIREVLRSGADVTIVKNKVSDLDKRLYGNGQPGDVANIKSRLQEIETYIISQKAREAERERLARRSQRKHKGLAALISALVSGLGMGLVEMWKALHK